MTFKAVQCPHCGSKKTWKDGVRETASGDVQRYLCRKCGYRFSEKKAQQPLKENSRQSINTQDALISGQRLSAILQEAKKLDHVTETKTVAGEEKQTTKGKMLQFALHCRNEGLAEETVRIWYNRLKKISENAELNEPESVKEYIAKATFCSRHKIQHGRHIQRVPSIHRQNMEKTKISCRRKTA